MALWNYCTLGKSALVMFSFDLYDLDGSGEIEENEVKQLLREFNAQRMLSKVVKGAHRRLSVDKGVPGASAPGDALATAS